MIKLLEHLLIIEMLLCSGSVAIYKCYETQSMVFFLITSLVFFIIKKGENLVSTKKNFKIFLFLFLWVLCNRYIINRDSNNLLYLSYIMYMLGSLLTISCFDFNRFRNLLLKDFNIILIISIIVHFGYIFAGFPSELITIGDFHYNMTFGLFNVGQAKDILQTRLASVFWEPGQLQVIIFFVLILFLDELTSNSKITHKLTKFSILLVSLLLSQSTTGYLCLILLVLSIVFLSSAKGKYKVFYSLFSLLIGFFVIYQVFNSKVITDKFDSGNVSLETRTFDNLAMLQMTINRPIFGYGVGTVSAARARNFYNDISSSNGWLKASSELGIPYLFFFIFIMYNRIKYNCISNKKALCGLLILIITQSGESAIFFPCNYLYLFYFDFRNKVNINKMYHPQLR